MGVPSGWNPLIENQPGFKNGAGLRFLSVQSLSEMKTLARLLLVLACSFFTGAVAQLGVNYGRVANNLPSPSVAASLIKSLNMKHVKIFDANPEVLSALANTDLQVSIMVTNQEIPQVASNASYADAWVQDHVVRHPSTLITTILVGNEILSNNIETGYLLVPAMRNIYSALVSRGLEDSIKVSTPVASDCLSESYPPSAGQFRSDISSTIISPLLDFLATTSSPFHANIYPYFAYVGDPVHVSLDYALFGNSSVVVRDGNYRYESLLDAMLDSMFAAMEKMGYGDIPVVISETGWPSAGGFGAGFANAQRYNSRLRREVEGSQGTPRRPGFSFQAYIFALFNENEKTGRDTERNFGLLFPNGTHVYNF